MRILYLALFASLSILFTSCQQEIDDTIITTPPGGGGGGGGTGGNYQPLKAGSWWKYKDSASGMISTATAVSVTRTINNILYTAMVSQNTSVTDTAWQAVQDHKYYTYAKGVSPNNGATYDIFFNHLNDTASVGFNWQYTAGQGNGFTAIHKTTIVAKNLTITVAGKTYTNVIQTRLDFYYDIFGSIVDFGYYDYFTAKDVGIIRVRAFLSAFGMPIATTDSDLIDYHIQ